eukprot:CAMPEP_0119327620 /NCGR_PEP_ID=MMETSP1333-20130426/71228_1 /TAXON_ID=418940 /ORGANISM="Scyphosphaera apsteinii, Strain RCC1455" /LENGTH=86 /DNA_ID=CAMNT_0007336251 /DNA_START=146 /DNA_END=406 /DNA_ORIENTATION=-
MYYMHLSVGFDAKKARVKFDKEKNVIRISGVGDGKGERWHGHVPVPRNGDCSADTLRVDVSQGLSLSFPKKVPTAYTVKDNGLFLN